MNKEKSQGHPDTGETERTTEQSLEQASIKQVSLPRKSLTRRFVLPVVKVPLYLGFVVGSVVLMFLAIEWLAEQMLKRTYLGAVYPKNFLMARRDFTRPVSHYDYDFVPRVCLEYNTLKGNRYEYANNAGFREPRDITEAKPANEFRIFLVGGSTAYGLGAVGEAVQPMGWYGLEYRETISHQMEMILNATAPIPGKTIRVYNTAVWGYAYQHHLMRYVTKLRRYRPDLVVSLDGANEIPLVSKLDPDWQYFQEGQFSNILQAIFAYDGPGLSSYLTLWLKNNTFLMTYLWSGKDIFQELTTEVPHHKGALTQQQNPEQTKKSVDEMSRLVDRNIGEVVRVVEDYHSALENDGVKHIFALQPWFYLSKKPLEDREKALKSMNGHRQYFGVPSDKMYQLIVEKIKQSAAQKRYFVADFSDYFDDVSEWVFTDWCHLTAGANYLVAKELSNLIKQHVFGRTLMPGDLLEDKDSYFWDLAASGTLAYAPPPDSPKNGTKNMFSGYPGELLYSSRPAAPGDRFEVVLDLGRTFPVSRLRLVWADEAAVPEHWAIEASEDQKNWRLVVQADQKQTDNFSKWPGFEYYGAEPVQARFLRYRPTTKGPRTIRLRSWSAFR
jgi:hypothetical protein